MLYAGERRELDEMDRSGQGRNASSEERARKYVSFHSRQKVRKKKRTVHLSMTGENSGIGEMKKLEGGW